MKQLLAICALLIGHIVFAQTPDGQLNEIATNPESILTELCQIKEIQDSTYNHMRSLEYNIMSEIKNNTAHNFELDGFNITAILALFVSVISVFVGFVTYNAQKKTEGNTMNAPLKTQIDTLNDLPRHSYRNLVCTIAALLKYNNQSKKTCYPSEANLYKLQMLPDDIFLPINVEEKLYGLAHELKLLFRNYNIEIKVASEHLSRPNITKEALAYDIDNLLFKPFYLTTRTFDYHRALEPKRDSDYCFNSLRAMVVLEHFKKLSDYRNFQLLLQDKNISALNKLMSEGIKLSIDTQNSIHRSLSKAFITINRDSLINRVFEIDGSKREFIENIVDIDSKDKFTAFCEKYYKELENTAPLYDILNTYFNLLNKDEWNFEEVFYMTLSIDAAIEISHIGMVNYSKNA